MSFTFGGNGNKNKIEQQKSNRAKKEMIEYEKAGSSSSSSTAEMSLHEALTEEQQLILAENMSLLEMEQSLSEKEQLSLADKMSRMGMEEQTKCDSELYCATMKELIFKTIPFYDANRHLCIPYHYANSLKADFTAGGGAITANRLPKEIASLHNLLPISANSTIFARSCEERLDVMKVLIIGPAGTPYANGCFEFDVFFPSTYPNEPMRINFETTGHNRVRFNPNLYEGGKVCLSILNTWPGRPEERWDATKSSLLQVLVSIQAMVFVEEPFYNEPGYENMRNTPNGERLSCEYNVRIRQMCIRWAMIEHLQNPPKAFADVIECHFWLKWKEICAQVEEWIEDCKRLVETGKVSGTYLRALKVEYEKLKTKFSTMKCPSALQHIPFDKNELKTRTAKIDEVKEEAAKNDEFGEYNDNYGAAMDNCLIQ